MQLSDWLAKIEKLHPAEIELGLTRIATVANRLTVDKPCAKVILVGGTNGKGSTVATLESLALHQQISVGTYTSPHLVCFNERIRVDGRNLDDSSLVDAFGRVERARGDIELTFFEFTTLAALLVFAQHKLDLIVLEVGLGGRLDAVNIIEPDVAIVTSIGLDHTDWLGNSLEAIAAEKAGIFRSNSYNLVGDETVYSLIQRCNLAYEVCLPNLAELSPKTLTLLENNPYFVPAQNIILALLGFRHLFPNKKLDYLALKTAIEQIKLAGRFQRLDWKVPITCDVGHNPQACKRLAQLLIKAPARGQRIIICGMMRDKAIEEIFELMKDCGDRWIMVDLNIERAESGEKLACKLQQLKPNANVEVAASVGIALDNLKSLSPEDEIFVFGSFITVGNLLQYLGAESKT